MSSERYECVCSTCETSEILGTLRTAQQHFNGHAEQGCEVVLQNVSASDGRVTTTSPYPDVTGPGSTVTKD